MLRLGSYAVVSLFFFNLAPRSVAHDSASVRIKWEREMDDLHPGFRFSVGKSGTIYAVSQKQLLIVAESGQTLATVELPFTAAHDPLIGDDGKIYVIGTNKTAVALNPAGTVAWTYTSEPSLDSLSSGAALDKDGTLYIGGSSTHAIDPQGNFKWKYEPEGLTRGVLAIGSDGNLRLSYIAPSVAGDPEGEIHVIDRDGYFLSAQDRSSFAGILAIDLVGNVYPAGVFQGSFGTWAHLPLDDGGYVISSGSFQSGYFVSAYDREKNERWKNRFESIPTELVTTRGGGVLVHDNFNYLSFYDYLGTNLWNFYSAIEASPGTAHSIALHHDGTLYIARENKLTAIQTDLRPAASGWAMAGANAQHTSRATRPDPWVGITKTNEEFQLEAETHLPTMFEIQTSNDLRNWEPVQNFRTVIKTNISSDAGRAFFRLMQK